MDIKHASTAIVYYQHQIKRGKLENKGRWYAQTAWLLGIENGNGSMNHNVITLTFQMLSFKLSEVFGYLDSHAFLLRDHCTTYSVLLHANQKAFQLYQNKAHIPDQYASQLSSPLLQL